MQHAATLQPFAVGAARPLRLTAARRAAAAANGAGPVAALSEGSRVRVTAPIKVFHAPKYKAGLDLQGKEGTVVQPNVCDYKHHDGQKHQLSANLPVKASCAALYLPCICADHGSARHHVASPIAGLARLLCINVACTPGPSLHSPHCLPDLLRHDLCSRLHVACAACGVCGVHLLPGAVPMHGFEASVPAHARLAGMTSLPPARPNAVG